MERNGVLFAGQRGGNSVKRHCAGQNAPVLMIGVVAGKLRAPGRRKKNLSAVLMKKRRKCTGKSGIARPLRFKLILMVKLQQTAVEAACEDCCLQCLRGNRNHSC